MKDPRQSDTGPGARSGPGADSRSLDRAVPFDCATMEQWLTDSAENTLPAAIAEQVRVHAADCADCREKLAQARSGREWLLVLKQEVLEPPVDLVAKILARTSLAGTHSDFDHPLLEFPSHASTHKDSSSKETAGNAIRHGTEDPSSMPDPAPDRAMDQYAPAEGTPIPAWQRSSVVVLRRTLLDPRLALVAAMAFFSISLTLNMLGFRLTSLHAADLKPGNMHRAVVRQVAYANASIVRYYENLRIVYEVEARVQQLRRAAETNTPPQSGARPRKQSSDAPGDSSGNSSNRPNESQRERLAAQPDPKPIVAGPRIDAALELPIRPSSFIGGWEQVPVEHTLATSFVPPFVSSPAPQAASCSFGNTCFRMRYFSARERRLA